MRTLYNQWTCEYFNYMYVVFVNIGVVKYILTCVEFYFIFKTISLDMN